jgi:cyanate permease
VIDFKPVKPNWQRNKPHYAWIILASVMAIYAIGTGVRQSFGVLIDPLVEQHGWSRSAISVTYALPFLISIPVLLVVGKVAERLGSRRIVIAGAGIFTIGMLLTSTVTQIWQFHLYWGGLIGGLATSVMRPLLPVLLTKWFYRKLGIVIGLMWTSMSWGPAIISPLMRWAISSIGWRDTFIIFGLIGGALMLLCSFFIMDDPKAKKLLPYGGLPPEPQLVNPQQKVTTLTSHQVIITPSFLAMVAVHAFGCIGHSIPWAHMVSIATFVGVPAIAAAGMLSITAATSLISRFGMSLLAEARGGRFTLALALLFQTLPIVLLLYATELPLLYTFAFLFGLGYGGEMVGFPIFNRQYYGPDAPLSTIYSYQMVGASIGMAVGGWLGGALFDLTGDYTWSILAAVTASFLGIIAALTLPSHKRR